MALGRRLRQAREHVAPDSKGGTMTSTYDAANRLTARQFSGNSATLRYNYNYSDRNEITKITRFSDTAGSNTVGWTSLTYDARGRTTNIKHRDSSDTSLQNTTYTYDDRIRPVNHIIHAVRTWSFFLFRRLQHGEGQSSGPRARTVLAAASAEATAERLDGARLLLGMAAARIGVSFLAAERRSAHATALVTLGRTPGSSPYRRQSLRGQHFHGHQMKSSLISRGRHFAGVWKPATGVGGRRRALLFPGTVAESERRWASKTRPILPEATGSCRKLETVAMRQDYPT